MDSNRTEYGFAAVTVALITGGLVGAALGFLFTPRAGVETRERIKRQAAGASEKAREGAKAAKKKAEGLAEATKEKISEVRGKVQESVKENREKGSSQKEETDSTEA